MVVSLMFPAVRTAAARACTAVKIRCQVPSFAHRSNRLNTVFHGPNRAGTSRHGAPVRYLHTMPSTTIRWSSHGRDRPTVAVSYTHLRAHETRHDLVCRL